MDYPMHPAAVGHLPWFITPPGSPDILFYIVVVFLIAAVVFVGNLYFQLHALPEHISHRTNKVQVELVAVLALIALFTHEHIFWIAALLLALVDLPDFSTPFNSIAESLQRMAQAAMGREQPPSGSATPAATVETPSAPAPPAPAEPAPSEDVDAGRPHIVQTSEPNPSE